MPPVGGSAGGARGPHRCGRAGRPDRRVGERLRRRLQPVLSAACGGPRTSGSTSAALRRLFPANPINHIRYFTSRVAARPDAPNRPEQQNAYLRALSTVPGLSIHLGHFQSKEARLPVADPGPGDPRIVEVIKTQEKGSDVNLATFLLLDAFRKKSDIAVVISNDSDLKEPIRVLIQELNVPVGLVNPHPVRERIRDLLGLVPLFFKQVQPRALRACQFPPVLRDAQGEIRRPDGW